MSRMNGKKTHKTHTHDEGVPSWGSVDLSLVVTLYALTFVCVCFFFIFFVLFTKQAYVCMDEEREWCGDTLVLMCL